jgi:hypothetical protein
VVGAQFDLRASDDPAPRLPVQGWITGRRRRPCSRDAGLDFDALRKAANKRGFKAVPLDAKASVDAEQHDRREVSRNVVGVLPGTEKPDEAIVYMAHWDHLGKHPEEPGDNIYNGAIDNATGVAGSWRSRTVREAAAEAVVLFLAVTLEESGLLGSKYYVAHPACRWRRRWRRSTSMRCRRRAVEGHGGDRARQFGARRCAEGDHGQAGSRAARGSDAGERFYFRSDHFNFAKAGVPALYAEGGEDLVAGVAKRVARRRRPIRPQRYHKPADEFDPNWNLEGRDAGSRDVVPGGAGAVRWDHVAELAAGNPFRAARDASRAAEAKP